MKDEQAMTEEDVIEYCRQRLGSYKKPKKVEFVSAFPRTQSGKIQKFVLREQYSHGGGYIIGS